MQNPTTFQEPRKNFKGTCSLNDLLPNQHLPDDVAELCCAPIADQLSSDVAVSVENHHLASMDNAVAIGGGVQRANSIPFHVDAVVAPHSRNLGGTPGKKVPIGGPGTGETFEVLNGVPLRVDCDHNN